MELIYGTPDFPWGKLVLVVRMAHRACTIRFMVILILRNCHPGNLSLGTGEVFQALEVIRNDLNSFLVWIIVHFYNTYSKRLLASRSEGVV